MLATQTTRLTLLAALGNLTVTVVKLVSFALSGSGAMLAEALHSLADTLNAALLWLGIWLSRRPPDERHHYGYGADQYFWSFISAVGVFMVAGGATVYDGIRRLVHPVPIHVGGVTWAALGIGACLDGAVLVATLREASRRRGARSWRAYLADSTDTSLLAVLFEDAAALLGLTMAAAGLGLARAFDAVRFDAGASIAIGLLMVAMALSLARRNRVLLLGVAAAPEIEARIREVVVSDPAVGRILGLRTRVLAMDAYRVDLQVDLNPDVIVERLRPEIRAAAAGIHCVSDLEAFSRAFARRVVDELALEVDRLEGRIRDAVPRARVIDVEGD